MPAAKLSADAATREAFDHADEVFTVASSAIDKFRYDTLTETLFVTFASGETYFYADVPAGVWESFKAADSKGTFFQGQIRDRYDFGYFA